MKLTFITENNQECDYADYFPSDFGDNYFDEESELDIEETLYHYHIFIDLCEKYNIHFFEKKNENMFHDFQSLLN